MAIGLGNQGSSIGNINVTPLIDVLLVLLILFMVITPLKPLGLNTAVPQPPASGAPPPPVRTVVVEIASDLTLRINSELTAPDELGARLAAIFKTRAGRVLFVKAANDVEFRHVAQAIDIARGSGVDTVALLPDRL
jgi:biopolymer transport protein ExbD